MILKKHHCHLPQKGIGRILIRGTNWIGDAVMTLPAISAIRATYPRAYIAVLAKPWVADIYAMFSDADDIILYEKKFDSPTGIFRLANHIKKKQFDAAILLQNAIEAAIIALAAKIPLRAGYNTDGRGLLLTNSVRRSEAIKKVHQTLYYLEMVKALGCTPVTTEIHLETKINPLEAQKVLKNFLADCQQTTIIGMAPGATYGAAKRWFPERFAQLADQLARQFSPKIIILGSQADEKTVQEIKKLSSAELIDLTGKTTLREAVYLMAHCDLFISNDSGLMHIAGALNIPTVAIFGSTNPLTTGPVGRKSVIVRREVPCSPCLKETCPTDFQCMKLISVNDVLNVAGKMLRDRK